MKQLDLFTGLSGKYINFMDYIHYAEAYEPYWDWWTSSNRKPFTEKIRMDRKEKLEDE